MAQFKYANELQGLLKLDGPLTKGPMPRWQKKALEQSANSSALNSTKNATLNTSCKTPTQRVPAVGSDVLKRRTPSTTSKTPSKSRGTTPNKCGKTPTNPGDRFIPLRSATNFDLAHYKIKHEGTECESPTQQEMQRAMCESIQGLDINKQRVLAYQKKAPCAPDGFQNPMRVLYSQTNTPASVKNASRYIPQAPDRILDAPDIVDDYYLNLMDWSSNNILAAALGPTIYLWDAGTGKIDCLLQLEGNDYVCSVAWVQDGDYLAVGTTSGTVELWDCTQTKRLRIMDGHSGRVGALSWNSHVLTSGSRTGHIVHHDVRQRDHNLATIAAHTQEVCGLKWSTDGRFLATGGNDNVLNVYAAVAGGCHTGAVPLYTFTAHMAAVKALAWCPWQPHILASGGGTADRHIRFWNCNNGTMVNAVDTKSQVCALLWSTNYKELVSGHGFANNQLIIWKYPSLTRIAELTGHTARVLHLAMSPDGATIMSAGADETLRLWKCFVKDAAKVKKEGTSKAKQSILNKQCIR